MNFYAFNILECSEDLSDSKHENFKWLGRQGFDVILNSLVGTNNISEMINKMKEMSDEIGIPIDGMVASFDSVRYSNSLQETSHHPLHSMAYKFFDESTQSILRAVEWRTTRMGQVNPTAIFDNVVIDNTDVSRASLHNLSFIEGLQLSIGARVLVSKRNLIIPHIEDNLDRDLGLLEYPKVCPSCGEKTVIKNTGTADFLFCENDICSAKLLDKFVHFVKRDCMNVDGLSSASLELFISERFLKTFDDIYNLALYKNRIIGLEGWGIKSYNKLITAVDNSRKVKCSNLIYALGIPNVGASSSKMLSKCFNEDFTSFTTACAKNFDFSVLEDFGDITNQSIHKWFHDFDEVCLWSGLIGELDIVKEEPKKDISNVGDNPFKDQHVYPTGKFSMKKDDLKIKLESLGAIVESGYKKSLDMLICGGDMSKSGKGDKAKKDGVKMVSEEYLMEYLK